MAVQPSPEPTIASFEAAPSVDFAAVYVSGDQLLATCQALRQSLQFEVLVEVTAYSCAMTAPRPERWSARRRRRRAGS